MILVALTNIFKLDISVPVGKEVPTPATKLNPVGALISKIWLIPSPKEAELPSVITIFPKTFGTPFLHKSSVGGAVIFVAVAVVKLIRGCVVFTCAVGRAAF